MKNNSIVAMLVAVVATIAVACPGGGKKKVDVTRAPLQVTIDATCQLGSVPSLYTDAPVKLTYDGPCDYVTVDFGGTDLFGTAQKQVNKGETVDLKVNAASGSHYVWTLTCSCPPGDGHTTPEIKVGDPPPNP